MKWFFLGLFLLGIVSLTVWLFRKKLSQVLNFALRIVGGFLAIYFVNLCLNYQQISVKVGYNPVSALTLGILGVSGFFLLYGIALGKIL